MLTNTTKPSATVSVMDVLSIRQEHYLKYSNVVFKAPRSAGKSTSSDLPLYLNAEFFKKNTHWLMLEVNNELKEVERSENSCFINLRILSSMRVLFWLACLIDRNCYLNHRIQYVSFGGRVK
jgi:hypothetical protein